MLEAKAGLQLTMIYFAKIKQPLKCPWVPGDTFKCPRNNSVLSCEAFVLNCVACQCSSAGNKGHNVWQENIPHNYTTTRSTALLHTLVLMSGYISHLPSYQLEAVSPPSDLWPLITSATTLKSLKSQFFLFLMLSTSSLPCSLSCCHGNICST